MQRQTLDTTRTPRAIRAAAWSAIRVIALVVLLMASGCGPSNPATAPVVGTVTYKEQVIKAGLVQLIPIASGNAATGQIGADGTFKLTTFAKDDGAVPGKYKVVVQAFPEEGGGLPGAEMQGQAAIPEKYMNESTTDFTVEILEGENKLFLDLKD